MVLIPAGSFLFGSKEDDKDASSDEKPQRIIELDEFYMDVYPVTNRQYAMFLEEIKPGKSDLEKWMDLDGEYDQERCRITKRRAVYEVEKGYEKNRSDCG